MGHRVSVLAVAAIIIHGDRSRLTGGTSEVCAFALEPIPTIRQADFRNTHLKGRLGYSIGVADLNLNPDHEQNYKIPSNAALHVINRSSEILPGRKKEMMTARISHHQNRHNLVTRLFRKKALINKRAKLRRKRRKKAEYDIAESLTTTDLSQWACATDVDTLRLMFGKNRNKFWGDLDNETARRLYHTLLPRALMGLYEQGLAPDELAPLAYSARVAAKQYARERSNVPGRFMAVAYDGFRHLKKYGNWSSTGLSWEEIWSKYENEVKNELHEFIENKDNLTDEEITDKICLRILERSCNTNGMVDRLCIKDSSPSKGEDLKSNKNQELIALASKFESDVNTLLKYPQMQPKTMTAQEFYMLRLLVMVKRELLKLQFRKKKNA